MRIGRQISLAADAFAALPSKSEEMLVAVLLRLVRTFDLDTKVVGL